MRRMVNRRRTPEPIEDEKEYDSEDDFYPLSLPIKSEWLRSATVEKRIVTTNLSWQKRLMVMTDKHLLFAKTTSDRVVECIPLVEILKVQIMEPSEET
eukprot:3759483-Rhodomonas_salina.1